MCLYGSSGHRIFSDGIAVYCWGAEAECKLYEDSCRAMCRFKHHSQSSFFSSGLKSLPVQLLEQMVSVLAVLKKAFRLTLNCLKRFTWYFWWGDHTLLAYSKCGCTRVLKACSLSWSGHLLRFLFTNPSALLALAVMFIVTCWFQFKLWQFHTKDGSLLFPIAYHPFQINRKCHFRVLYILLKSPVFWCKVPPTLTSPTRDLCLFSCPGPPGHFLPTWHCALHLLVFDFLRSAVLLRFYGGLFVIRLTKWR